MFEYVWGLLDSVALKWPIRVKMSYTNIQEPGVPPPPLASYGHHLINPVLHLVYPSPPPHTH